MDAVWSECLRLLVHEASLRASLVMFVGSPLLAEMAERFQGIAWYDLAEEAREALGLHLRSWP
jgi:hypothetical protein